MSKLKHLSISTEAIDFQNGAFFKELTLAFTPYVEKSSLNNSDYNKLAQSLDKIIQRHTGINSAVFFSHSGTCVYVPEIDASNPILGLYSSIIATSKDGIELIERAGGRDKGLVDLNKSELKGVFSKPKVRINIEYGLFTKSSNAFTPEEISAILLHEVGHYFTYCEMFDKVVAGNLVLMGLDRALRESKNPSQRETIIEKAGQALNIERNVIQNLKETTSDKVITTVLIAEYSGTEIRSQSKNTFYDENSWEMTSDQFATRHGAGRHMVTALDKIYILYGFSARQSKLAYYIFETVKAVRFVFTMAAGVVVTVVGGLVGMFAAVLIFSHCFFMLAGAHSHGGAPLYDKPLDRAMRVRRQLIEYSKDGSLSKEIVDKLVEDVKFIDDTVRDYADRKAWLEVVDEFIFKSSRRRADNAQLQKDLEKLAMNDLFLSSAELRHL